ncbi:MAG TPA: hypothetical protein VMT56_00380 [Candidatus Bathyarchaeia archaeon]|nr:hypothetical protein [Candidatus Bathyarchaeia archaeon]
MKRATLVAFLVLSACGGSSPKEVTVKPSTVSLSTEGTQAFTATPSTVTWSTSCGSITAAGVYTAPASAATCIVTATDTENTSISGTATVTVTAPVTPVVTISPVAPTMDACTTLQFATTYNMSGTVSYSVGTGAGSVTASGLYTAPSSAGTYQVVATGSVGGAATATVTVVDHILSVAVSPTTANLNTGGLQQFTATVTTTCGTFAATGSGS